MADIAKVTWLKQLGVEKLPEHRPQHPAAEPAAAPEAARASELKPEAPALDVSPVQFPAKPGPAPATVVPAVDGSGKEALTESPSIPGLPIPIPIPDIEINVTVTLDNRTGSALELVTGSAKLEHDFLTRFTTPPPAHIAKGRPGKMAINSSIGAGGEVAYSIVDDPAKTVIQLKWDRGRVPKRETFQEVRPPAPDKWELNGAFANDDFTFTLTDLASPGPHPGPDPGPAGGAHATCMITVTNNTKSVLTLAHQGHDVGDFMTFPAASVAAGASTSFVSTQTANEKDQTQGCKGFAVFDVGEPAVGVWRVEWNNPKTEKNTASATIDPASAGFRSLEQAGQGDENVPMVFTLSGGPEPGPGPQPQPQPGPEPDFVPPPEGKQPTLRVGDKSHDGWVEYMQFLLRTALKQTGSSDGTFGPQTLKSVIEFQTTRQLMADGVVGNQTWAALREGAPEAPSTDGRKPHSFEDRGPSARWTREKGTVVYSPQDDILTMSVDAPGEQPVDGYAATVRITPPGGKAHVVQVTLGKPVGASDNGEDKVHFVRIVQFRATYPSADPKAPVTDYLIDAYLDAAIGGDRWTGNVVL